MENKIQKLFPLPRTKSNNKYSSTKNTEIQETHKMQPIIKIDNK